MQYKVNNIDSKYNGYNSLAHLAGMLKDIKLDEVKIDMQNVDWFDANMCAPFGAILY